MNHGNRGVRWGFSNEQNANVFMRITGTFLDEITHDIPSQNWGEEEWARDFDAMRAVGIDTVILIRAGYRQRATFDSQVLREEMGLLPVYTDLVDLFLAQAERCGMQLFFGTYDSGTHWQNGRYDEEARIGKAFCEEVAERYAHRDAFAGWYLSHEIDAYDEGVLDVYEQLARHMKALEAGPLLISPYIRGPKQFGPDDAFTFREHLDTWEAVFERIAGVVDAVAFQDGNVPLPELPRYLNAHHALAERHELESWSNVETFDRDMPINFPPIDFRKLRYKMEAAAEAGAERLITFEFSHFMSPNSTYPAARNLHRRYRRWLAEKGEL